MYLTQDGFNTLASTHANLEFQQTWYLSSLFKPTYVTNWMQKVQMKTSVFTISVYHTDTKHKGVVKPDKTLIPSSSSGSTVRSTKERWRPKGWICGIVSHIFFIKHGGGWAWPNLTAFYGKSLNDISWAEFRWVSRITQIPNMLMWSGLH